MTDSTRRMVADLVALEARAAALGVRLWLAPILVTIDAIGLSKSATTRANATRSASLWARRCPSLPEIARIRRPTS